MSSEASRAAKMVVKDKLVIIELDVVLHPNPIARNQQLNVVLPQFTVNA